MANANFGTINHNGKETLAISDNGMSSPYGAINVSAGCSERELLK